jgi:N-acetylneuraminate synthase/N,N'-diacetyllegionaminate synthase
MRIGIHDLAKRVLVVAEAGNNHEGSFACAEEMIARAADAGADAIKFQTIVPERLVSSRETARLAQLSRFCFSYDQFAALAKAAERAGISFLSTPFDTGSVSFLEPLVPAYKVASGDNDCFGLLESIAATGKPIFLSTGMLDLDGVARAVSLIESVWRSRGVAGSLVLMHCVVAYPTPPQDANLGAIRALAKFGHAIGYSDHTIGNEAAVLSVALGARVIEKHFTLDKNLSEFRDHKLSSDPAELADLVRRVRGAEALLGTGVKRVMPVEEPALVAARRSIMAARDLPAGTRICAADLTWLRPRAGLRPGEEAALVGRQLAIAVRGGEPILPEQLG